MQGKNIAIRTMSSSSSSSSKKRKQQQRRMPESDKQARALLQETGGFDLDNLNKTCLINGYSITGNKKACRIGTWASVTPMLYFCVTGKVKHGAVFNCSGCRLSKNRYVWTLAQVFSRGEWSFGDHEAAIPGRWYP